jgi:hypothetical protein
MKHINILIRTLFSWAAFSWAAFSWAALSWAIFSWAASSGAAYAQNTANITLTASKQAPVTVTLVLEDVHFHPNLGTGLADIRMDAVASVNFADKTSEKTVIQLTEPKMMRLQYSGSGVGCCSCNPATT